MFRAFIRRAGSIGMMFSMPVSPGSYSSSIGWQAIGTYCTFTCLSDGRYLPLPDAAAGETRALVAQRHRASEVAFLAIASFPARSAQRADRIIVATPGISSGAHLREFEDSVR